jgi:hypothetical protein
MNPTPDNPRAPQDAGQRKVFARSMDGYLTLMHAIPRGYGDAVAYKMGGVVGATVRKWCREPGTDKDASTGKRSPLDRVCDLISAVFDEVGEEEAELIVDHVRGHLANLKAKSERRAPGLNQLEEKVQTAQMLISEISNDLRARRRDKTQAVKR